MENDNPTYVANPSINLGASLSELMEQGRTNPRAARQRLTAMVEDRGWSAMAPGTGRVLGGLYFLAGDFAEGYVACEEMVDPSMHLALAEYLGHPRVTAWQAFKWAEYGAVTSKGNRIRSKVWAEALSRLDAFHADHGVSMLFDFWRRLNAEGSIEDVATSIEDDVLLTYTGEEVRILLERGREASQEAVPPTAFRDWPEREQQIEWPVQWIRAQQYYGLIRARFRGLMRESENAARLSVGIPGVGEKWTSEMKLLKEIREAFPIERVVHQARPWWLRPQSLDIYFTDWNVAIEYQGKQHSKPVEFFGGEEAFELRQQHDLDKLSTCLQNDCTLIEVQPGYILANVIVQIDEAIGKKMAGQ